MTAINTQILANPDSCRSGADYLKRVAEANHDAATSAHRARSMSESGWSGNAGDAFRALVQTNARDTDELVRVIRRTERALRTFADQIQTCLSRMDDARRLATEGGVTVTGWWIHKPSGADTYMPSDGKGSTSLPGLDPEYASRKRTEEKLKAWSQAEGMVSWARRLESTAHEELNGVLADTNKLIASLMKPSTWIGNAAAYAGALHGAATKLQSMAEEQLRFVAEFKRWAADTGLPAETRQARIAQLMANYGLTQQQANSNARALGNLGNTKIGNAVFNPLTKTLGGTKPGLLRNVGRAFGVPGVVLTAFASGQQILVDGKPVGKTISANFLGLGWGAVGTAATGSLLGGLGIATAPATITAVGVGAAVTWGYGYLQDNTWGDLAHDAGEVAENVGKETLNEYAEANEFITEANRKHPGSIPLSKW